MLIFAFGLVYSIIKYDLFNITPTILLEQIIETMPIGFVLADEQKKILRVNDKVKDITNQQSSFFINRNLKDLIVEITNSTIDIENDIFFYKKTELSLLNNNKSVVFYFKPITDKHNRILAFVLMINDIEQLVSTEKKLAKHNLLLEKRVKERTEDLLLAKEKAEESNKLKTAFLQNISHEIRTPLNAISGFSGLLNIPDLSEEKRKKFVSIIQNSSNQLASMVTDILTISSLETKQIKSNIDKVCLNHIITDLLVTFKQQAIKNNISLNAKQTLTDKQSEIFTDKTKLIQILTNLINNALKFTHQGFIEFGYSLINNNLEFYVKDSGIGIDPKYHEKIFERFGKINTSTTKLFRGTGIGLPISKEYVELLGGKIWVLSEANKGSSFYFTIPYKPVFEIDNNPTLIKQNKNSRIVLVAEDEEYNFFYIKELLINKDIKIIRAKNGKETVEIFKEIPDIALILMDIKMPVMTGYEAAKIIKKLKPDLPIIAQSAYALYEREKYERIFDDYIIKPIDGDYLLQKILKYIEH
ncbi:MAG: ATP-binding protein [Thiohalospira sp.]